MRDRVRHKMCHKTRHKMSHKTRHKMRHRTRHKTRHETRHNICHRPSTKCHMLRHEALHKMPHKMLHKMCHKTRHKILWLFSSRRSSLPNFLEQFLAPLWPALWQCMKQYTSTPSGLTRAPVCSHGVTHDPAHRPACQILTQPALASGQEPRLSPAAPRHVQPMQPGSDS